MLLQLKPPTEKCCLRSTHKHQKQANSHSNKGSSKSFLLFNYITHHIRHTLTTLDSVKMRIKKKYYKQNVCSHLYKHGIPRGITHSNNSLQKYTQIEKGKGERMHLRKNERKTE